MWKEIGRAFQLLGTIGDGCRCVLLRGNGKSFCAGLDLSDAHNLGLSMTMLGNANANNSNDNSNDLHDGCTGGSTNNHEMTVENDWDVARRIISFRPKIQEMQRAFSALEECPIPVVAAIHGPCIGAGIDLSCCADVRLCCSSATFSVREVRLGLAADVGTLQRLPKIVGYTSKVRELCFTGEDFTSHDAERMGFVSCVCSTEEELFTSALEVCKKVARNSPVAVMGTKLSLNYSRDHSVAEGLEHIAMHNSAALMTNDLMKTFLAASSDSGEAASFSNLLPHSRL